MPNGAAIAGGSSGWSASVGDYAHVMDLAEGHMVALAT